MLLGLLPIFKCLPIQYDPKPRFIYKLRHHLPFAIKNSDIPISVGMDNGLVTLTNKPPTKWGFERYHSSACDDSLANKGWLWCYFKTQKLMLINTHMQAAGAGHERLLQLRELKGWLERKWESKGLVDKCLILGDFNVDMESHPERVQIYNDQREKNQPLINELHEDEAEENKNNDIILVPSEINNSKEKMSDDLVASNQTEIALKMNADIEEELGDDPLTCLSCHGKESLVDNLRKMQMIREGGKKTKFTKKAYINIPHHLGATFHKINRYEPTFKRADYNIDHIFANFKCHGVKNNLLALGRYKLSDHRLVVSEFTTD